MPLAFDVDLSFAGTFTVKPAEMVLTRGDGVELTTLDAETLVKAKTKAETYEVSVDGLHTSGSLEF